MSSFIQIHSEDFFFGRNCLERDAESRLDHLDEVNNSILESTSVEFFEHLAIADTNSLEVEKDLQIKLQDVLLKENDLVPFDSIPDLIFKDQNLVFLRLTKAPHPSLYLWRSKRERFLKDLGPDMITFHIFNSKDSKDYKQVKSLPDADADK